MKKKAIKEKMQI